MTEIQPPAFDLSKLSIAEIRGTMQQIAEHIAVAKQNLELLQDELAGRVSNEAAALFQAQSKTSGDVTFVVDGVKLKASVSKTVKWDSDKLKAIASAMPWEAAHRIFDIDFKVPEATFKAIPDPELVAKLEEARTVKYGEMTIKPI